MCGRRNDKEEEEEAACEPEGLDQHFFPVLYSTLPCGIYMQEWIMGRIYKVKY